MTKAKDAQLRGANIIVLHCYLYLLTIAVKEILEDEEDYIQ